MCIQQPQDSSQRSAVIAHYNQSSWAHLSSPFGIKIGEKKQNKTKQPSTDTSPAVCLTQISGRGAKWKDGALQQGLYTEDNKALGQKMVAGEGTHKRYGTCASAQPAAPGSAVTAHKTSAPSPSAWTVTHPTQEQDKLQDKSLPCQAGLTTPAGAALTASTFTSPSPEAGAKPQHRQAESKGGKWEHWGGS